MGDDKQDYYDYFSNEDRERLARMLMLSRAESGLSQEKVALELGIAKKTVQHWERGTSAPTLPQAIEWFRVMHVPAMPYFLQFMFPDLEGTANTATDEALRNQLIDLIGTMPSEGIRQLMFLFYGEHGSSPRGILNMLTAHLQCPLRDRYNHANLILDNYKLALEMDHTLGAEHAQPNIELLEKAIERGRKAILKEKNSYTIIK